MEDKILTKEITRKDAEEKFGVANWGTWGSGVKKFDWDYHSGAETCYILKGEAEISDNNSGNKTTIKAGMFVYFPKGLECVWNVTSTLEKFYSFDLTENEVKKIFDI